MPPAAAGELVDWTAELTNERLFDWAGGLIWLALKDRLGAGRREPARGPGRSWRARDAGARARPGCAARSTCSSRSRRRCAALTERVKRSFDPKGVLNPGRMYAGI